MKTVKMIMLTHRDTLPHFQWILFYTHIYSCQRC